LPADELAIAAAALSAPAPLHLRVNTLRADRGAVLARLATDHPGAAFAAAPADPDGISATGLGDPERSPSFADGWWTVQDLGAQRVAHLLRPQPGQRLLDACAGVGGKSTHLAQLTGDRAHIDAADLSARRLALGETAARRLGVTGIRFHTLDLTAALPGAGYDGILLDAPCSGLGVLRRHPEAKWRLTPGVVGDLAALQARLLDRAVAGLAPGGALVYSVCTFTDAEGPAQVAALRARHGRLAVDDELVTWPHRDGADGFYAARLVVL
ncbi:MAG TPA: class I SAM-dependent methyltransferase, partial [Kofleriaceae bacterium]|nr:class I SAM-dependent methyltransferase [Kofleriaceae bacterium]